MNKKRGRPTAKSKKDTTLDLRLSADEKMAFMEAAAIGGLSLSVWVRQNLRRAAARELEDAGRVAAFLVLRK
jgi:uncharacterized protein (DUF1778 family)